MYGDKQKMITKTKAAIFMALCLVFAVGSIGSFVNLSGIVNAYEATIHAFYDQNGGYDNHAFALTITEIQNNIANSYQPYCRTNSC